MVRNPLEIAGFGRSVDSVYSVTMRRNTIGLLMLAMTLGMTQMTFAKVALELKTITLGVGESVQLKASGADGAKWESSNPKIASAYQNGFVIGLKAGKTS